MHRVRRALASSRSLYNWKSRGSNQGSRLEIGMLKKCGYGIEDPPCTVQPQLLCTTFLNTEGPISGLEGLLPRSECNVGSLQDTVISVDA